MSQSSGTDGLILITGYRVDHYSVPGQLVEVLTCDEIVFVELRQRRFHGFQSHNGRRVRIAVVVVFRNHFVDFREERKQISIILLFVLERNTTNPMKEESKTAKQKHVSPTFYDLPRRFQQRKPNYHMITRSKSSEIYNYLRAADICQCADLPINKKYYLRKVVHKSNTLKLCGHPGHSSKRRCFEICEARLGMQARPWQWQAKRQKHNIKNIYSERIMQNSSSMLVSIYMYYLKPQAVGKSFARKRAS